MNRDLKAIKKRAKHYGVKGIDEQARHIKFIASTQPPSNPILQRFKARTESKAGEQDEDFGLSIKASLNHNVCKRKLEHIPVKEEDFKASSLQMRSKEFSDRHLTRHTYIKQLKQRAASEIAAKSDQNANHQYEKGGVARQGVRHDGPTTIGVSIYMHVLTSRGSSTDQAIV